MPTVTQTMRLPNKPTCIAVSTPLTWPVRYYHFPDLIPFAVAQMKGKEAQQTQHTADDFAGLSLNDAGGKKSATPPPPPRPPRPAVQRQDTEEEEDEDDPFGDSNVVETPAIEKGQPRW
jgi:hypothetical protein